MYSLVKLMYSEKVTKFCEISILLLTDITKDKSKVEISQNFVAFSEYMNFSRELESEAESFRKSKVIMQ